MLSSQELHEQGILYFKSGEYKAAQKCWEKSADAGNASSMFCLGLIYLHKDSRDIQKAKAWLIQACEAGHKNAKMQLEQINKCCDYDFIDKYFRSEPREKNASDMPLIKYGKHEWIVVKEENGQRLCISKDIIDIRPYHLCNEGITWEKSDIRKWLNTDFAEEFSKKEIAKIISYKVVNESNPIFGTWAGNDTEDKIFLLSLTEILSIYKMKIENLTDACFLSTEHRNPELVSYVNMDEETVVEALRTSAIDYRLAQGQPIGWWLRTPGASENRAIRVNCHGVIRIHGREVDRRLVGIRPAFWIGE